MREKSSVLLSFLVVISVLFVSGCTEGPGGLNQTGDHSSYTGQFKISYYPTLNTLHREYERIFREARSFETLADGLNDIFYLPRDITIMLEDCGTENAFYDPSTSQIIICYELIDYFGTLYYPYATSEEELGQAVIDTTFFVFFHEMGHALIDVYQLPAVGKQEDAVDQLSVLVLLDAGEAGERAVLNGAMWFFLKGQDSEEIAWDVHSSDAQRFYELLCLIYGKDPEKYQYLVDDGYLPEARAQSCEYEYETIFNAWNTLLAPYVKT